MDLTVTPIDVNKKKRTIIESVRDYLLEFPHIADTSKMNIDYLPEDAVHHSISPLPSQQGGVLSTTIGGDVTKEYSFSFSTRFPYSEKVRVHFENSGFLESFVEWIEENEKNRHYPQLDGNKEVQSIEVLQTPSLFFTADGKTAEYLITMRIIYDERR